MRKVFLILLLCLWLGISLTPICSAADNVKDIGNTRHFDSAVVVGDLTTGNAMGVGNAGGGFTTQVANGMAFVTGSGLAHSGACRFLYAKMKSSTAGDTVGIYDTISGAYPIETIEFELIISANNGTDFVDGKGVQFVNGINILSTNANAQTSVIFDY